MGDPRARFVADSMLGRLARWLRAFGFDVVYHPFADDHQVIAWARERGAIVLTRDTGMPKAPDVRLMFINDDRVEDQLRQVAAETPLDLRAARPMTRCTVCNRELTPASRDEVWRQVPPFVYLTAESYARCPDCGRVYWEGTHASGMRARLAELSRAAAGEQT